MFYLEVKTRPDGTPEVRGPAQIVPGRADATEVTRIDAVFLQGKAEQKWPEYDWQIERTYLGKYLVRGQMKI